MQRNMRLLPIEQISVLTCERQAMRLCMDAYNRNRDQEDKLEDHQWAALLGITKGQLSEYLNHKPNKPKHIPEQVRRKIQRLTGYAGITQFNAYQNGFKLTAIDDNDQLRLKQAEADQLRKELESLRMKEGLRDN